VLAHETVLKIKRPIEEMSSDLRDLPNANVKDNLIKRGKRALPHSLHHFRFDPNAIGAIS